MLPWPLLPLRWHSSCAVPSSPPERTAGRGGGWEVADAQIGNLFSGQSLPVFTATSATISNHICTSDPEGTKEHWLIPSANIYWASTVCPALLWLLETSRGAEQTQVPIPVSSYFTKHPADTC